MKYIVYKTTTISASHFLPGHKKCGKMHGHNYKIEVWCSVDKLVKGMVVDFDKIKAIISEMDHKCINDLIVMPTAENMCLMIFIEVPNIVRVRIWETDNCYAEISK